MLPQLKVRRTVDVAVLGDRVVLSRGEAMVAENAGEAVAVIHKVVGLNHQLVVDDWLSTAATVTPCEQSSHVHRPQLNPFTADPVKALHFAI